MGGLAELVRFFRDAAQEKKEQSMSPESQRECKINRKQELQLIRIKRQLEIAEAEDKLRRLKARADVPPGSRRSPGSGTTSTFDMESSISDGLVGKEILAGGDDDDDRGDIALLADAAENYHAI
jgi:hypothetical protein